MRHPEPTPHPVSGHALRKAAGRFATGVTLVTCRAADGRAVGLTVNSFSSVSLEPPLVLWSLRSASPNAPVFRAARHFVVNVLAEPQIALARRFASAVPHKFDAGLWHDGAFGAPVLADCAAVLECEQVDAREVGDHWLFTGQVMRVAETTAQPLVYRAGHFHGLGGLLE